jgi:ferredoxin
MGGAIHHLKQVLSTKSQILQAGWYVNMPENYILWFNVPAEEKQRNILQKASKKVVNIADKVQRGERVYEREPFFWLRPIWNNPYLKAANQKDCHFRVEENCNSCGICQKVCPVGNIVLTSGSQPQWQHRCQECLACLHFCPQNAIDYGTRTISKIRYHHPDVTVRDMMMQSNSKEE